MGAERVIEGHIVDVVNRRTFDGKLVLKGEKIERIVEIPLSEADLPFIIPGFIDSHIHIESSMLRPVEFARQVVKYGTIAAVCDCHEITNVMGKDGLEFMLEDGKRSDLYFFNGVPSCVPATEFETSGFCLDDLQVGELLKRKDITHLSEMMNYPGVLGKDTQVLNKISHALKNSKPVDGHAPLLTGKDLAEYAAHGISSDHECASIDEAEEKIRLGMKIQIREGSAAKNFDALIPLIDKYPDALMFCSDDKHPDDILEGHINLLVKRASALGYNVIDVLRLASMNPILHYKLPCGLLQVGDNADFLLVDDLENFNILATYIKGKEVFSERSSEEVKFEKLKCRYNNFGAEKITEQDIKVKPLTQNLNVIDCFDKQLFTDLVKAKAFVKNGYVCSDTEQDVLKIVVLNRYFPSKPVVAFVRGFGLKKGALAGSIAHDSHNIICVGVEDLDIIHAVNLIVEHKGGISFACGEDRKILPLSVAGLMSDDTCENVAFAYKSLNEAAKSCSCKLTSPFMTLSFMALLVIPKLKISDKGLFDSSSFSFKSLFC
ncbi:MAG: adenine deaminase [Bacteroidales bacterium]|nr:adenine deaminase [Bacteroidales bacterium]